MAVTVTLDSKSKGQFFSGTEKVRRGSLNLGTYATNGVAITAANFQLKSIDNLVIGNPAGYVFEWDKTNSKIKAYRNKNPADAGGADIPLPEVANAVNLAAVTARFEARGT